MHDAPVRRDGVEVLLEIRLSNEIDDDVDPAALGGGQHFLRPVLRLVVEPGRGAEGVGAKGEFLWRARGDIDSGGAGYEGELNAGD